MTTEPHPLDKLREPFPAHQISKLPKETKAQKEERERDRSKGVRCQVCGGWHHKDAIHLDYVGHAALTDRLLDTDPLWAWEPVSFTPEGLPAFDRVGGLWIKLTVCGVTRLGYGNAEGKSGGDAVKEIIGDALRNAAMRFGAALDLWHKGDLHADEEPAEAKAPAPRAEPRRTAPQERREPPPSANPVDRTAEAVPAPTSEDTGDWEAWRKVVASKIKRATTVEAVNAVQAANAAGISACAKVLPDTVERMAAFVSERIEAIEGETFPGNRPSRVANGNGQLHA